MKKGKIIAILGGPASGKSTLIRRLKTRYKVSAFLEGEESDLPLFIKRNISKKINGLQTILFFHNQSVGQYLDALKLRNAEKDVLLDTFWISNLFFLDSMLSDKNERQIVEKLIFQTSRYLPAPDRIVYLKADSKTIRQRTRSRARKFERGFIEEAQKINSAHDRHLGKKSRYFKSAPLIKVNVKSFDFSEIGQKLGLKLKK
ncbi:deoxynucleoside kinase [Patescibacteria group bacterium]|nr:deoxynucleoside kinase [Patescibacteria group bacterium]MBU1921874.1 deoxynucleoside kinase [Patescibacteria group bacterium]